MERIETYQDIPGNDKQAVPRIHGLDGLRFFSFLVVVINHAFAYLEYYGYPHHKPPYIISIGVFAIQYFFAGSGFLITYMLYAEKASSGGFHLGKFYMRRILRIWPGYYILVLLTYFVVYYLDFFTIPSLYNEFLPFKKEAMLLFFLFLPQLTPFAGIPRVPYLAHTYTIGIEEQFYIIWGLLFKFFNRYFFRIILFLFLIGLLLNGFVYFYSQHAIPENKATRFLYFFARYYNYSRITTFCMGAFLCRYFMSGHSSLTVFRSALFQIIFYTGVAYIVYSNYTTALFYDEFKNIFICCLLLIAAFKNSSIINYSHPFLVYLGKISYGVYLFHLFAIVIIIRFMDKAHFQLSLFSNLILVIVGSCLLSILFGIISYHTVETWFLRFKQRFDFKRTVKRG